MTESISHRGDGLVPSELRVCLGPVAPDSIQASSLLLKAVLDELGQVHALGHAHVSESYDSAGTSPTTVSARTGLV